MFGLNTVIRAVHDVGAAVRRYINIVRREYLVEQYVRAGAQFGEAIHEHFMGGCVDLEGTRTRWAALERQYAALGYRTISIADFIEIGAYGRGSEDLIRSRRDTNEEPVLYAEAFEKRYSSGFALEFDLEHIMKEGQHCGKHHLHDEGQWEQPRH